jgi:hypothetical protein
MASGNQKSRLETSGNQKNLATAGAAVTVFRSRSESLHVNSHEILSDRGVALAYEVEIWKRFVLSGDLVTKIDLVLTPFCQQTAVAHLDATDSKLFGIGLESNAADSDVLEVYAQERHMKSAQRTREVKIEKALFEERTEAHAHARDASPLSGFHGFLNRSGEIAGIRVAKVVGLFCVLQSSAQVRIVSLQKSDSLEKVGPRMLRLKIDGPVERTVGIVQMTLCQVNPAEKHQDIDGVWVSPEDIFRNLQGFLVIVVRHEELDEITRVVNVVGIAAVCLGSPTE